MGTRNIISDIYLNLQKGIKTTRNVNDMSKYKKPFFLFKFLLKTITGTKHGIIKMYSGVYNKNRSKMYYSKSKNQEEKIEI